MGYETMNVEKGDKYLLITLNRPPMNPISRSLLEDLNKVLDAEDGDDVLSIIITGGGEKAFCAGADLKAGFGSSPEDLVKLGQGTFTRLERLGKPVIAAINGFALGGGCEMALACTFRLIDANAKMGLPESNLGILPGYGGTQRMSRLIRKSKALELMIYGGMIGAEEAVAIGLADKLCEPGTVLDKAKELAALTATRAPIATRLILDCVNSGLDAPTLQAGLDVERANFLKVLATKDAAEGIGAFLQKRKAEFKGK